MTEPPEPPAGATSPATDGPWAIETVGLSKRFGHLQAVREVNLRVPQGLTYGLLGPNGSGKTTLIRLIVGILRPTAGSVRVLGHAIPSREALSQVGYMTQLPALYQELTVRENVRFFAQMHGDARRQDVDRALELVDLARRADTPILELSGGLKQRASLACALVHRPRLLLLDEPTVGVDPQLRAAFWEHFHRLNEEGVTIIVSSHVMDEAERCHRLGMMREGLLLAEGSADELRRTAGTQTLEEAFLRLAEGTP